MVMSARPHPVMEKRLMRNKFSTNGGLIYVIGTTYACRVKKNGVPIRGGAGFSFVLNAERYEYSVWLGMYTLQNGSDFY